jgi:hypothetical protein
MKRADLLRSKEYWVSQIQNELFSIIEEYMLFKKLNRTQLADELKVTKGYISQVLNGDFDHKVSKLVDLSLASGKVPLLHFIDTDKYIRNDSEGKQYDLFAHVTSNTILFHDQVQINQLEENRSIPSEIIPTTPFKVMKKQAFKEVCN